MANNITIKTKKDEPTIPGIRYCVVTGAKYFNRCAIPTGLRKGDMFNVYRREYETDQQGNITRWICDVKYGCIYDGHSLASSLATCDNEIAEWYTTGNGRYNPKQPIYA